MAFVADGGAGDAPHQVRLIVTRPSEGRKNTLEPLAYFLFMLVQELTRHLGGQLGGADDRFLSSALLGCRQATEKRWPAPLPS